jgi:hypothetical protein
MRTLGGEVVRSRWGKSAIDGGRSESFAADHVAVLACCTAGEVVRLELAGPNALPRTGVPPYVAIRHSAGRRPVQVR